MGEKRSRRHFLRETALLTVGGALLAGLGCGEDEDLFEEEGEEEDDDEGGSGAGTGPIAGTSITFPTPAALQVPGGTYELTDPQLLAQVGEKTSIFLHRADASTITAVSTRCTHQGCQVNYQPSSGDFLCPCHGARFLLDGTVTKGPAKRDLFRYRVILEGGMLRLEA